ncbi:hypothetical protein VY88_17445 [Azospirillum thiophilum]|uniref:Type VI secretion system tube protein Hcp n=1 Tax=Azospirillum thiophilum TaxID=528244 RepID=A0AAC8W015_9PROT|nr:type VI secretion system tube protein TssD [Azospirillum thiophilum]ALG72573.1 hypothetical protein AL072_16070 [Azospirillum thiophilum]KJR64509.1 hypothetical protein VY88_17445 [Azospirillum thiophilum]
MDAIIMKIGDKFAIEGESTLDGHAKQIDLIAVEHEITLPVTFDKSGNSRTRGRSQHGDIIINKYLDKASAKLLEACSKGVDLGKVQLYYARTLEGKFELFWEVEITDVYVSSVKNVSRRGQDLPQETVTLNYTSIKWTYSLYNNQGTKDGSVSAGWDLAQNKAA